MRPLDRCGLHTSRIMDSSSSALARLESWARAPLAAVLAGALAIACYLNTLHSPLLYDDITAVLRNPVASWGTPVESLLKSDFWGTPLDSADSHKSFRPITTFSFRLNNLLDSQNAPEGYHAVNIVLHALVSVVATNVLSALLSHRHERHNTLVLFAALLFATHPIHTDAVDNAVGRAELLSALFVLLGLLAYLRCVPALGGRRSTSTLSAILQLAATLVLQALATFSKEPGILLGPLCALLDVAHLAGLLPTVSVAGAGAVGAEAGAGTGTGVRRGLDSHLKPQIRLSVLVLGTALLAGWRLNMNGSTRAHFEENDITVGEDANLATRILSLNYFAAVHAGLLVWPANLSHDWSRSSITPVTSLLDARNAKTVALYSLILLLVSFCLRDRKKPGSSSTSTSSSTSSGMRVSVSSTSTKSAVFLGLVLLVVPFGLSCNALVRVGFTVSERSLYLPSLGFCILVAALSLECAKRHEGLAGAQGDATSRGPQQQQGGTSRPGSILAAVLLVCFMCTCVGLCAWRTVERNRDWRSEEALALSTLRHLPNNAKVKMQLVNVLVRKGRLDEAEFFCRAILATLPEFYLARFSLHSILFRKQQWGDAEEELLRGLSLAPAFVDRQLLVKRMAEKLGEEFAGEGFGSARAERFLRRVREFLRPDRDYFPGLLLVNALIEQKKFAEARGVVEGEILAAAPQSVLALNTLGYLHLSAGDWLAARTALERAASLNGTDAGVLQNLAAAHFMLQDFASAEAALQKCLAVNPGNTQALTLLGKTLRALGLAKEDVGRRLNEYIDQHPDIRAEMDVAWAVLWSDVSEPNQ